MDRLIHEIDVIDECNYSYTSFNQSGFSPTARAYSLMDSVTHRLGAVLVRMPAQRTECR
jgi:hypothetical protein